ncbi:aldo/keto reductase [Niabella drilacis]|uniref:Predicted oxidoreductase n=1 Tax=Niabella drilacis (strain DSM 25811 / CCM 8410 / CCUG 62505 / LMG 26954 / E90) TaxID=1285928 RepID=A0A1G6LU91_NIADE|nr:aldo/keto reductase [Niabella drilacis]SDC46868.1 Predicted oxidoreductase [Niabella drilacis]
MKMKGPIQKIALGTVTFGREIDRLQSFRVMDEAAIRGILFFDTAEAYGQGASETIIGSWLQAHPSMKQQVTIASKLLPPYSSASFKQRVEACLRRLKRSYIDLLFFHSWDPSVLNPDVLIRAEALIQQGVVKAFGVSNFNAAQLTSLLEVQQRYRLSPVAAVQNNHNLAVSDLDVSLLSLCRKHQVRVITYSPLGAGFLTGKHTRRIEQGSRFDRMPAHRDIYFTKESLESLQRLSTAAGGQKDLQVQWALAWALHHPDVDLVLVGARSVEHLQQAVDAALFDDPDFLQRLRPFK